MNCERFQDAITDYLDGELEPRARAEFAAHRLRCRTCREVFSDVRDTLEAMSSYARRDFAPSLESLESRILDATTAGEMLSCNAFDRLLEKYFDGVILAPTFQTFQAHFDKCHQCRRLLRGIEDAIDLCREVKQAEVAPSDSLAARIMAATVGEAVSPPSAALTGWTRWQAALVGFGRSFWTPQWAAAALILAAGGLLVSSRYEHVTGMADRASTQAERLVSEGQSVVNQAVTQTGSIAVMGFERVSESFTDVLDNADRKPKRRKLSPTPSTAQPSPPPAKPAEHPEP